MQRIVVHYLCFAFYALSKNVGGPHSWNEHDRILDEPCLGHYQKTHDQFAHFSSRIDRDRKEPSEAFGTSLCNGNGLCYFCGGLRLPQAPL